MRELLGKQRGDAMSAKSLMLIAAVTALTVAGMQPCAIAQTPPPAQRTQASNAPVPRIEINPRHLLYRRCKDWYVIQYRPSGTVLFPQTHCWWVRG
jgi:hypothetical protein